MIWLYGFCLFFLIWAAITDMLYHQIYNYTTYTGIILAFLLRLVIPGEQMLEDGLKGFGICLFIMLVCFILYDIGGGDLKLISMTGAFLGFQDGITMLLWTLTLGAIMAVIILIWKIGALTIIKGTLHHLWLVLKTGRWVPMNTNEREPLKNPLFLGPAALLAFLFTCAHKLWS